jgi:hypothetical protein
MKMVQLRLEQAIKGYIGGCALRDKMGVDYYRKIGYSGGCATFARYGPEHMRRIAALSVERRRKMRENDPRTVKFWDGSLRRIVPYKPVRSRAKKAQYVQISLDDDERGI